MMIFNLLHTVSMNIKQMKTICQPTSFIMSNLMETTMLTTNKIFINNYLKLDKIVTLFNKNLKTKIAVKSSIKEQTECSKEIPNDYDKKGQSRRTSLIKFTFNNNFKNQQYPILPL